MLLSQAVIAYELILIAAFAVDFMAVSRHNDRVVAKLPPIVMLPVMVAMTLFIEDGRSEFVGLALLVLGAAIFGYANFLAFVKRGVTFSILSNHTRPSADRIPDYEFIGIDDRLREMHANGWAREVDGRWQLTLTGHRVARIRRLLMRLLNIEAVG